MLRKPIIKKPVLLTSVPRGGFIDAKVMPVAEEQKGRGNFGNTQSKGYEPPTEVKKLVKKRSPNGNLVLIDKEKKPEAKQSEELVDDKNNINWELIEKNQKRKPCVKLIKKLTKQSDNEKQKKMGHLFFNMF
jgi:hypothetical protein